MAGRARAAIWATRKCRVAFLSFQKEKFKFCTPRILEWDSISNHTWLCHLETVIERLWDAISFCIKSVSCYKEGGEDSRGRNKWSRAVAQPRGLQAGLVPALSPALAVCPWVSGVFARCPLWAFERAILGVEMMTSHLRDAVRMTQLMHGKCWSQRLAHRWCLQTMTLRTSLVVQCLRICLLMQGMQVQSLVQELRSHIWWVSETLAPKL